MKTPPGLHLKIAEWMLDNGEAVSAYDISENFGITIRQSRAFLTILEKDNAIETRRGEMIPVTCCNSCRRNARTIKVISIDRDKIAQRRHHYNTCRHCPLKSINGLSRAEKWEFIIRNALRRKK
ncbi:hypothetical protein DLR41_25805 [Salmonella enterica subsp. enterica serovar Panama]|nr:hypothetical protein [Salmonella enterica subsp. enterica serovar Panama]